MIQKPATTLQWIALVGMMWCVFMIALDIIAQHFGLVLMWGITFVIGLLFIRGDQRAQQKAHSDNDSESNS
jgi:hypothetical protein